MNFVMRVLGLEKTKSKTKRTEKQMRGAIARKAIRAGAKLLLKAARAEVPKHSGKLKKGIKIFSRKGGKGVIRMGVGVPGKLRKGAPLFYDWFITQGFKHGSRKLGDARKSVPANPYMDRAFASAGDAAHDAMVLTWAVGLDKEGLSE